MFNLGFDYAYTYVVCVLNSFGKMIKSDSANNLAAAAQIALDEWNRIAWLESDNSVKLINLETRANITVTTQTTIDDLQDYDVNSKNRDEEITMVEELMTWYFTKIANSNDFTLCFKVDSIKRE